MYTYIYTMDEKAYLDTWYVFLSLWGKVDYFDPQCCSCVSNDNDQRKKEYIKEMNPSTMFMFTMYHGARQHPPFSYHSICLVSCFCVT